MQKTTPLFLALFLFLSPSAQAAECVAHWIENPGNPNDPARCIVNDLVDGKPVSVQKRVVTDSKEACEDLCR